MRRARPSPERPLRWPAAGLATLMIAVALVLSAGVCAFGAEPAPGCLAATVPLEISAFVFSLFVVLYLAYLVFGTDGRAHPLLTLWRIADVVLAHLLGQSALTFFMWKVGAMRGDFGVFSHTGALSTGYAAYDLIIYTVLMLSGGGVVDNAPLRESVRLVLALQLAWNSIAVLIVLSAAVATLAVHTRVYSAGSLTSLQCASAVRRMTQAPRPGPREKRGKNITRDAKRIRVGTISANVSVIF